MDFLSQHIVELAYKTWQQIYLAGIATLIAIFIGVPAGIAVAYRNKLKSIVLGVASIIQTVPSLALLVMLLPFLGIGIKPALVALALYAILPIVRNTVTGLVAVDESMIEAANGLGFTGRQKLFLVQLPLALPVIVAGVRTATTMSVGIATLATFIGAGGLGDFIYQGLSLANNQLILLGAVPAALLALILDFLIALVEKRLTRRRSEKVKKKNILITSVIVLIVSFGGAVWYWQFHDTTNYEGEVRIGSKNFTEQIILGYIMADMIKAKTHLKVIEKFNLGGTLFCHKALISDQIDMYPEYTGTAYMDILKKKNPQSPQQVYQAVKKWYLKKFNVIWLQPFGYNNTNALAVRQSFAKQHHLQSIGDLVPLADKLSIALVGDCLKRADCYNNLRKQYGLTFRSIKLMDPSLLYSAIKNKAVEVGEVFTTDGRIAAYHLIVLKDNKHAFPPYYAAPIVRQAVLKRYPQIRTALKPLAGIITNRIMQQLNYQVDVKKETPAKVAHDFLVNKKLI